jgi:hypothetical protein
LIRNIRAYENAHIVLWILKDFCWVMSWRWLGMSMIFPTLVVAIDIARRSQHNKSDLSHNLAVCCWIAANATWMTGEFYFADTWRPFASVFFSLGLMALAWHYVPAAVKNLRS